MPRRPSCYAVTATVSRPYAHSQRTVVGEPGLLLSAALIVRNEERFLEACLRSLHGRVDEIVMVDTGSTDRSPRIAADLGARVVHRAWGDDFAFARNASFEAARGNWVLYIDADEQVAAFDDGALAYDRSIFGANAHAALGLCAFRLGRYADSAAHYARAEAMAPGDAAIRVKRMFAAARASCV